MHGCDVERTKCLKRDREPYACNLQKNTRTVVHTQRDRQCGGELVPGDDTLVASPIVTTSSDPPTEQYGPDLEWGLGGFCSMASGGWLHEAL